MKKLIIGILCGIWLGTLSAGAQCAAKNDAIQPGERLTYELKFNWKFIWVKAGEAKMNLEPVTYEGKNCYKTTLLAVSNSKVDFFFKMRDTITCITTDRLEPVYFRKGAEEGSRYTVDEAWFKFQDGKSIVNQQRWRKDRETVYATDTLEQCVFDMLSILLQARSFDPTSYKKGDKIHFPMQTTLRSYTWTAFSRTARVTALWLTFPARTARKHWPMLSTAAASTTMRYSTSTDLSS